jgi:Ca-activated chloride channel homolog
VDRSGSMRQEFLYDGERLNRLETVKHLFKAFVRGNDKDLGGRPSDLIGLVAFARYADTLCPLTLSHDVLGSFIDTVTVVTRENEDGTAIGDALALAAARLRTAEEQLEAANGGAAKGPRDSGPASSLPKSKYEIKSKVIILLTDGQNNAGRRSPREAARLAAEWGIKVYAVGIGGRDNVQTVRTPFGEYRVPGGPGVDESTLKAIAEETGGAYWLAQSADDLREVYKEIDRMEKTEIESIRYMDYGEKFVPFVLVALGLLLLEQLLLGTVFRRLP